MKQWARIFEGLIFLGLVVLLISGMRSWGIGAPDVVEVTATSTPAVISAAPTLTATPQPTWTPSPTATPTATPSPTNTPTPTATPTETPGPIHLPAPPPVLTTTGVITSLLPQPTPMPIIWQPKGTINILLLGSDRRPGEDIARTDVLLVASVFPDMPAVSLISIPRDYYAWIPTWGLDKINTAYLRGHKNGYPGGGPGMIKATVEYNFGIPIHYYAMVDFNGYRSIVDAVGGVDIVVECPFHDTYPDEESATGATDIDLEPGVHHLDGKYALWYSRSRWNTSDFDRHRRQQKVLYAIYAQAMSQNMVARVPELWSAYQDTVETDMSLTELLYLGSVALRLDMRDAKSRFIRGDSLLRSMTAPNGGAVLAPNHETLYSFMQEAAQPPVSSRASQRAYRVAIRNGTGNSDWGIVAAERLRLEGFEVVSIEPTEGTPRTEIVDYTTTSKGSPLYKLLSIYKRQSGDIISEPVEGSPVDFQVTLGWDYDPCVGTVTARWKPTPMPTLPEVTVTPTPEP
ncbi:MAG: LCP family protein [Anaerolineae bacterium]|nr:LCP family protein [Anaerolineae bacterium]